MNHFKSYLEFQNVWLKLYVMLHRAIIILYMLISQVYGAAVTFYEDFDLDKLSHVEKEQLDLIMSPTRRAKYGPKTVHHNKCICLLSRWPFFSTFKTFLHYLYRISISGPHPVPIERSVKGHDL
jgi:hypothetical protein